MSELINPANAVPRRKFVEYKADIDVKRGERSVIAAISTDSIDRDKEVVLPKGIDKTNYLKNPIVLWAHDYRIMPIGRSLWVKNSRDGRQLISKTQFNTTDLGEKVFNLYKDDFLKAFSIGFMANKYSPPTPDEIKSRPELVDCRLIIRESSLLEYSAVPVPSNPDALVMAISKGLMVPEEVKKALSLNVNIDLKVDCEEKEGDEAEKSEENVEEKSAEQETESKDADLPDRLIYESDGKSAILEKQEDGSYLGSIVDTNDVGGEPEVVEEAVDITEVESELELKLAALESKIDAMINKINSIAETKTIEKDEPKVVMEEKSAVTNEEVVKEVSEEIAEPPVFPHRTRKSVEESIIKKMSEYSLTVSREDIERIKNDVIDRRRGRV